MVIKWGLLAGKAIGLAPPFRMLIHPQGQSMGASCRPHLPQEVGLSYDILPVTVIPTPLLTSLPLWWSQGFSISFFF